MFQSEYQFSCYVENKNSRKLKKIMLKLEEIFLETCSFTVVGIFNVFCSTISCPCYFNELATKEYLLSTIEACDPFSKRME